jgi:hypothetical protein
LKVDAATLDKVRGILETLVALCKGDAATRSDGLWGDIQSGLSNVAALGERHDEADANGEPKHLRTTKVLNPDPKLFPNHKQEHSMTRTTDSQLCSEMRSEYTKAQAKADSVYAAFGDSAPRYVEGERLNHYRQRLLEPIKKHSPEWRSADLSRMSEDVLRIAEAKIYSDAAREAREPSNVPAGTLVERVERDATGRKISRFYGSPSVWMDQFKSEVRYLTGWKT